MLRELTEGQQATPKILTQSTHSPQPSQGGTTINKAVGILTNNLKTANPIPPINLKIHQTNATNHHTTTNNSNQPSYEDTLRASHQENKEMREAQKRIEAQISNLAEMLKQFTNQTTTNSSTPPPNQSPLPSQPLPNPKGGLNMVQKKDEEIKKKKEVDRTMNASTLMIQKRKLRMKKKRRWKKMKRKKKR
ncbi:hypothetical protein PIB30_054098 [Stylosanthes scabra]|uniref:Uncharacterized protein n=1 Tax=Stylosanthes scabra TaxID=79078 RepID=A0ABU6RIR0_9FABA|nr:hypothetical protein [Stylosanthes scabra]